MREQLEALVANLEKLQMQVLCCKSCSVLCATQLPAPTTCANCKRALYGLKQAPRVWHLTLAAAMEEIGFYPATGDPSLYIYADANGVLYCLIYVDDLLLAGPDTALLSLLKAKIMSKFKARDLGFPSKFMGIKFDRDADTGCIKLSQGHAILDAAAKFNISNRPRDVPISPGYLLNEEGAQLYPHSLNYRSLVGSLIYIAQGTRPDVAFSVSQLSKFLLKPTEKHGAPRPTCCSTCAPPPTAAWSTRGPTYLGGCSDASHADQPKAYSTHGYAFMLAGAAIAWASTVQRVIAHNTTDAEYIAASFAAREAAHLSHLLSDFNLPHMPIPIACDNQSTIKTIENPLLSFKLKHIRVVYHYARSQAANGHIKFHYVPSKSNPADVFTKLLPPLAHKYCSAALGVQ